MLKKILLISLVAGSCKGVTLSWDYLTNNVSPELVFVVRVSPTVVGPATNWPIATNVYASNCLSGLDSNSPGNYTYVQKFSMIPEQAFFVVQSSNNWGLGPTSNLAWTSPAPIAATNLSVTVP